MKIICKKGHNAQKMLQMVMNLIEKKSLEYPLLSEDMEIEITLGNEEGQTSPDNDSEYCFDEEVHIIEMMQEDAVFYYNHDALTTLFNRGKYERDIKHFKALGYQYLTCIYIDAVGLHEINNHLGHKVGDEMLCSIADEIRKLFPRSLSYRIGGDEFVVLCPEQREADLREIVDRLKRNIRRLDYEISVGMGESDEPQNLVDMINHAENAMRADKEAFYRNKGAERQMRTLNHKLEKILLEKQDANQFLNVIAPRYKGVYMVNPKDDSCRYIYIPKYFRRMLEKNNGHFVPAIKEYCREMLRPEYYDRFDELYDYQKILQRLKQGEMINMTYQKKDGNWITLKITIYDQNDADNDEMQWIFVDAN